MAVRQDGDAVLRRVSTRTPILPEKGLTDARIRQILRAHGVKWFRDEVIAARAIVREGLDELAEAAAMWATGIDSNKKWCWCSAADDEHEAPSSNAVHASACVWLRELVYDIAPKGLAIASEVAAKPRTGPSNYQQDTNGIMSARVRFESRYPPYSEKLGVPGVSLRRLKHQDHKRQRVATKRAMRTGWEPPARKRNILYEFL